MTQPPIEHAPGRIVTFYSYKGGTGRSMALANVAWILASNGKRVLVVDWDIEAPGLHRYFAPFLADHELSASDGVIDFLGRYADAVLTPPQTDQEQADDWYLAYADITRLATSLDWKFEGSGTLDFIGAGRQSSAYPGRVANFPWQAFFERLGGGTLLDAARNCMRLEYDYILIDSRTGVSDAAGICTIQLPDELVVCFTLNNQSISGAASIARLVSEKPGKSEMPIFPVPMRVEDAEKDKRDARWKYAKSTFASFPNGLDTAQREAYWGSMEVRYQPYYAYEELLAVFGDQPGRDQTLLASMERLASHVSHGEVTRLPPMPERVRLLYRDMYAWQSDRVSGRRDIVSQAEHVLTGMRGEDQTAARRMLSRLVRVARPDEGGADARSRCPQRDLTSSLPVFRAFASAGVLRVEADPSLGEEFVELADELLVQRWPTLRQWIEEDRTFLLWRQQIRTYLADWQRTDHDRGALLSGRPLVEAASMLSSRAADLSDGERGYIEASLAAEGEERRRKEEEARRIEEERHQHAQRLREAEHKATAVIAEYEKVAAAQAPHRAVSVPTAAAPASPRRRHWMVGAAAAVIAAITWFGVNGLHRNDPGAIGTTVNVTSQVADLVTRAALAASSGDDGAVTTRIDSALALDASYAPAYMTRGAFYQSRGVYRAAVEDYGRAIAVDSATDGAFLKRGIALRHLQEYDGAIADLTRAIQQQPRNTQALVERGFAFEALRRRPAAIADYSAALEIDSSLAPAYARRAHVLLADGDTAKATGDLVRGLAVVAKNDTVRPQMQSLLATLRRSKPAPRQTGIALSSAPEVPQVKLQYSDANDTQAISDLYLLLRKRGWQVRPPERVEGSGGYGGHGTSGYAGVRYFRDADSSIAQVVRAGLIAEFARQGASVTIPVERVFPKVVPDSLRGVVEAWITSFAPIDSLKRRKSASAKY